MRIPFRFQEVCRRQPCIFALLAAFATSGCRPADHVETNLRKDSGEFVATTPTEVLATMVQAYRAAEAYSDRGVLCLRYEQRGTRYHDEAPFAVVSEGKRRLRVHAYQATVVCDGSQLRAHVADPDEDKMGRQVLLLPAPPTLSLDTLLADPVLQSAVTGGAGRLPVQLELLLSENPLAAVIEDTIEKRFLRPTRVEGHPCHGVEVVTDEGRFVFWIDKSSYLLRQLDYPGEVVPADLGAEKPHLVAEFRQARFSSAAAEQTFAVSISPRESAVSAFVVPPPPLPSPLLGKRVSDFYFLNPAGREVEASTLVGRVVVLLWFSDHPACRSALQQLERVNAESDRDRVLMFAVCAESSDRSHEDLANLLRQWNVHLPMVRDLRAFGRDLFALPGAPATVVLDAEGVVQWFEVGANPNLADELPGVLARILAGDDVAAATRAQYEENLAAFRAAIQ